MSALDDVVAGYVESMRPKGESFGEALSLWLSSGMPGDAVADLVAPVHKFAGSAGSAGFMRLSAVATLLEIGLRAVAETGAASAAEAEQFRLLGKDFAAEIVSLDPARSSLISGEDPAVYVPFERPLRVVLAGLPAAVERLLSHVVEQRMGMAMALPDAAALAAVPPGREPDLALTGAPVENVAFPVVAFAPRGFDDLAAGTLG